MNVSDSQRIESKLEDIGYKSAPNEKGADLLIINSCSVRQKAVDRIWGTIKNWQKYKNKNILITGCLLPVDQKKFKQKKIEFFPINELSNLKNIIQKLPIEKSNNYFKISPKTTGQTASFRKAKAEPAYIPIMTGCNNFCSYCAVPYTRGREKSRPLNDILSEIQDVLKRDNKNILLLGQNVNSYKYGFIKLLKEVDKNPADFQFNFISPNPHDMSEALIKTLSKLKKWPKELHLPLQSGDDKILKNMNRKYTSNQFFKLVLKLRTHIPDLILTTDIIVGFPSETKEQFNNTLKICKIIGFKKAYISQYSPRPGTAASKLCNNINQKEKKRRWQILDRLINTKN